MSETPLHPINPALSPVQVGEIVAFKEDHPVHGITDLTVLDESGKQGAESAHDGEMRPDLSEAAHAMYGKVLAVGLLEDGNLAFDLLVFDPLHGAPGPAAEGEPEPEQVIYRAAMGEIQ